MILSQRNSTDYRNQITVTPVNIDGDSFTNYVTERSTIFADFTVLSDHTDYQLNFGNNEVQTENLTPLIFENIIKPPLFELGVFHQTSKT